MIREHVSHFLCALRFITILPIGKGEFVAHKLVPFFPMVGLCIGAGLVGVHRIASMLFPPLLVGTVDVIYLCVITGAFHLDGLGDAADGLFSHRPREQALAIMKDSRVGIMGLVAVALCLLIKWAALSSLPFHRMLGLFLVPGLSRAGILFAMKKLPYGRTAGGTGKAFFDHPLEKQALLYAWICFGLCLLLGRVGIALMGMFGLLTFSMIAFFRNKMACITGDMLGAMVEVTEAGLFAMLCIFS